MSEKRDQLLGARFTQKERDLIELIVNLNDTSISDFIRTSVFSHISNISKDTGIDVQKILEEFDCIEYNANKIINKIAELKIILTGIDLNLFKEKVKHRKKAKDLS